MGKFSTALAILILLDLLFVAAGTINASQSGVSCLLTAAQGLGFDNCSFFTTLLAIVTSLGGAGIVIGSFATVKSDTLASVGFTTLMISSIGNDLVRVIINLKTGLTDFFPNSAGLVAGILVGVLLILIVISFLDWFRSPTA